MVKTLKKNYGELSRILGPDFSIVKVVESSRAQAPHLGGDVLCALKQCLDDEFAVTAQAGRSAKNSSISKGYQHETLPETNIAGWWLEEIRDQLTSWGW